MKKNAKDIFWEMAKAVKEEYKDEERDEYKDKIKRKDFIEERNWFYRKLGIFLQIVYKKVSYEKLDYTKLDNDVYVRLKTTLAELAKTYSLDKIESWVNIKDEIQLYSISGNSYQERINHIQFLMDVIELMLYVLAESKEEGINKEVIKKFKISINIYKNMKEELELEYIYGKECKEDKYKYMELKQLKEELKKLKNEENSHKENLSILNLCEEQIDVLHAILGQEQNTQEREKNINELKALKDKYFKMRKTGKNYGYEILNKEKLKRTILYNTEEYKLLGKWEEDLYHRCYKKYSEDRTASLNKIIREEEEKIRKEQGEEMA